MTKLNQSDMQQFSSLWNELILLLSIKIKADEVPMHKEHLKLLTGYLKIEYPGLSIEDIKLAYRLGVKCKLPGKGGEPMEMYAELNPRSIGKVLDAYEQFKREELSRNPIKIEPIALLEAPTPSQHEQDKSNAQLFRMAYQCAQQGRVYRDLGNLIYDWLDSKSLITFDKDRKWEFMKTAQEKIRREEAGHGTTGNMQEHKDARALADLLKTASEANQFYLPIQDRIKTMAKQIAFITLLNDLTEFEVTPEEFLQPLNQNENESENTHEESQGH